MKSFIILLLFVGMSMVIHGIYEEKLTRMEKHRKIEYRFIPRTFYDEQLSNTDMLGKFRGMFDSSSPWNDQKAPEFKQKDS